MVAKKIHCPICHGSGKISDVNYGKIACLNCVGTGIVDLDNEQLRIIDNINKQKQEQEFETRRQEQEKIKLQHEQEKERIRIRHEQEKQRLIIQKKEQDSNIIISVIVISCTAALIFVVVYFWDEIINFIWEVIKGIFYIVLGICIFVGLLKAFND